MVDQRPRSALAPSDQASLERRAVRGNIHTGGDKTALTPSASSALLPRQLLQCFVNFLQATAGQAETFLVCDSWGEMLR